jgi:tRNA threonylcarbamoyladenosine biosynthesis protein TsaB
MKLLAIECSTDRLSVAVCHGDERWQYQGAGGAQASATLIPAIMDLLAQASLPLHALDAIAFGRGPGAFTGLRTACAVAQGLGLGAHLPLLPIDTLMLLAQAAKKTQDSTTRVLAVLDARMGQVYVAAYEDSSQGWRCVQAPCLCQPENLDIPPEWHSQAWVLASNAVGLYPEALALAAQQGATLFETWPQALCLLDVAAQAFARGETVTAAHALPLYVRDKVALTSAERATANQAASST